MAQPNRWRVRWIAALLIILTLGVIEWRLRANRPAATTPAGPTIGEYFLGGAVPRPGAYTMTGRTTNLRQALVAAQFGPQQAKEAAFVTILRRTAKDEEEFIKVDPVALFERGEGNEPLRPDDQVTVVEKPKPQGTP